MTAKKRAIVLEDDANVRFTLVSLLEQLGVEVESAENEAQFRAALSKNVRFDFMLTDFDLADPNFDGVHAIHAIRTHAPDLPILVITGAGSHPRLNEQQGMPEVSLLTKPFSLPKLIQKLADFGIDTDPL